MDPKEVENGTFDFAAGAVWDSIGTAGMCQNTQNTSGSHHRGAADQLFETRDGTHCDHQPNHPPYRSRRRDRAGALGRRGAGFCVSCRCIDPARGQRTFGNLRCRQLERFQRAATVRCWMAKASVSTLNLRMALRSRRMGLNSFPPHYQEVYSVLWDLTAPAQEAYELEHPEESSTL